MARLRLQADLPGENNADPQEEDPLQGAAPGADPGGINAGPDTGAGSARQIGDKGQLGETPRERQSAQEGNNIVSAALRPPTPTPQAGQASIGSPAPDAPQQAQGAMPSPQGVIPFSPISGPAPADAATPRLRGLYGSAGGLQGGGLGVPFNSAQSSDPITGLIQMLMQQQQGG